MTDVINHTDGGCHPNSGPGGYGVVLLRGTHRRKLSGGCRLSTNNRMEIVAAIASLAHPRPPQVARLHGAPAK